MHKCTVTLVHECEIKVTYNIWSTEERMVFVLSTSSYIHFLSINYDLMFVDPCNIV
jgi:hypothetical protein